MLFHIQPTHLLVSDPERVSPSANKSSPINPFLESQFILQFLILGCVTMLLGKKYRLIFSFTPSFLSRKRSISLRQILQNSTFVCLLALIQVGNPYNDHQCWERPEDMDTSRDICKVALNNPGSDVAAEAAASSIVFKVLDPSYSTKLL
ncbi:endoglucanase 24-like isoform X1 [Apium graveolens]|uniref:endoglucanase 24-like isoform X1 n=1 Tax=Apium graveolens TaxID=4045 RepID=UPI003D79F256